MSKPTIWEGVPQGGGVRGTMAGTAAPPIRRVNENKGMVRPRHRRQPARTFLRPFAANFPSSRLRSPQESAASPIRSNVRPRRSR
jgi:hypothetical protein